MGAFDWFACDRKHLPEDCKVLTWQTKFADAPYGDTYVLNEEGQLCEWPGKLMVHTGEVIFYGMEDEDVTKWWEVSAYFVKGKLLHIEVLQRPAPQWVLPDDDDLGGMVGAEFAGGDS